MSGCGFCGPRSLFGKRWFRIVFFAAILIILLAAFDCRLFVRNYEMDVEGITAPVRIALITDLHSCCYGEGQSELIEAVKGLSPDLVLLVGDIFDDDMPNENTQMFLAGIQGEAPCYFVTGNHEHWAGEEELAVQMEILQEYGVNVLYDACETISVNGQMVNLCGVNDPVFHEGEEEMEEAFKEKVGLVSKAAENGHCTILLSHRPEYFDDYAKYDFDLVLCGHAHGGQWRLPGMLNGVYAPNQGAFPEHAGGSYTQNGTTMIVSRGLARESTRIPRVFNRPEVVCIDLE